MVASVIKPRDLIRTQPYNQASPDVCFRRELKLRAVIRLDAGPEFLISKICYARRSVKPPW